jgi:hypothetical protein
VVEELGEREQCHRRECGADGQGTAERRQAQEGTVAPERRGDRHPHRPEEGREDHQMEAGGRMAREELQADQRRQTGERQQARPAHADLRHESHPRQ